MEQFRENEIKQHLRGEPEPNYDMMWTVIEHEASKRRMEPSPNSPKRFNKRWVPAAIMAFCFLFIGVPVFAGVALNWNHLSGGKSMTAALDQGYGQRYDKQAVSEGVTMSLHGVVADDEKMKLLVSLDTELASIAYDAIEFEQVRLTDSSGQSVPLQGQLQFDAQSGKLLGIYEASAQLQKKKKRYTLTAESLNFYQYKEEPLRLEPHSGQMITTEVNRFPSLQFESVKETDGQMIVRYNIMTSGVKEERWDPHLILKTSKGGTDQGVRTILPHKGAGLLIQQEFDLSEQEWAGAEFFLSYLDKADRVDGSWKFDFDVDGKKAAEALVSSNLQADSELERIAGKSLQQLLITPLEIQVGYTEDQSMERMKEGSVWYNTVRLAVDGKEIDGGFNLLGDDSSSYRHVYQFESPEWYKDWHQASLQLVLKDAVVTKRDLTKNWVALQQPKKEKQHVQLEVEDFLVKFTYYMDGEDLIVESESDSPRFKVINQSMLRAAGEDIYPKMVAHGPSQSGKKVERYENLQLSGSLELNPGFYSFFDPERDIEVQLNKAR